MALRLFALLATTMTLVSTQVLNDLPQCAAAPFITAVQESGCAVDDASCVCTKQSVVQAISDGLLAACPPGDATKVLGFAFTWCGSLVNSTAEYGSASPSSGTTALPPGITGSPNGTFNSNITACTAVTVTVTATRTMPSTTGANGGSQRGVSLAALAVALAGAGSMFAGL